MAKYDNNDNVGAAGNATALVNHNTLVSRGICSKYFAHDHSPVYAERFMRSGTITQTIANNLLTEFQTNNLLDANNYLLYASDTIGARIAATPSAFPKFLLLTGVQKIFVSTQVDAMYAAHQFYSDYNKKTLRFFDLQCDTVSIPTTVEDFRNQISEIGLNPNPTSGNLTVSVSQELIGKEFSVFDALGRKIMENKISSPKFQLQATGWASGIYMLKIGNSVTKFIKE